MEQGKPKVAKVRFRELELARAIRSADKAGHRVDTIHLHSDGQVTLNISKRADEEIAAQLVA